MKPTGAEIFLEIFRLGFCCQDYCVQEWSYPAKSNAVENK